MENTLAQELVPDPQVIKVPGPNFLKSEKKEKNFRYMNYKHPI